MKIEEFVKTAGNPSKDPRLDSQIWVDEVIRNISANFQVREIFPLITAPDINF